VNLARVVCLVGTGAFAASASAQTIAPAEYLPLGPGAQWLYERASGTGPTQVRLDVIDVNEASSGTRYLVEVPLEGISARVRLEIATDRRLLMRAFEAQLNDVFPDLPFDRDREEEGERDRRRGRRPGMNPPARAQTGAATAAMAKAGGS